MLFHLASTCRFRCILHTCIGLFLTSTCTYTYMYLQYYTNNYPFGSCVNLCSPSPHLQVTVPSKNGSLLSESLGPPLTTPTTQSVTTATNQQQTVQLSAPTRPTQLQSGAYTLLSALIERCLVVEIELL